MLGVIMLNVTYKAFMLSAVMLSVVAPSGCLNLIKMKFNFST
jgi:hypothetical protein